MSSHSLGRRSAFPGEHLDFVDLEGLDLQELVDFSKQLQGKKEKEVVALAHLGYNMTCMTLPCSSKVLDTQPRASSFAMCALTWSRLMKYPEKNPGFYLDTVVSLT